MAHRIRFALLFLLFLVATCPRPPAQLIIGLQDTAGARWLADVPIAAWKPVPENARPGMKTWAALAPLTRDGQALLDVVAWSYWTDADKSGTATGSELTWDVALANGNLARSVGTVRGTVSLSVYGVEVLQQPVIVYDGCAVSWRLGRPLGWRPDKTFADWYFHRLDVAPVPPASMRDRFVAEATWRDETGNVGAQSSPGAVPGLWAEGCALRLWGDSPTIVKNLLWNARASLAYRRLHYYTATDRLVPWRARADPGRKIDWGGAPSFPGRTAEQPLMATEAGVLLGKTTAWDPQHCFRFIRHALAWQCTGSMLDWWAARAGAEAVLSDPVAKDPKALTGPVANQRHNGWPAQVLAVWARVAETQLERDDAVSGLGVILARIDALDGVCVTAWLTLNLNAGADHHELPVSLFQHAVLQEGMRFAGELPAAYVATADHARQHWSAGVIGLDWAAGQTSVPGTWAMDWDPRTGLFWEDGKFSGIRMWAAPAEAAACLADGDPDRILHLTDFVLSCDALRPADKNFDPGIAAAVAAVTGWRN